MKATCHAVQEGIAAGDDLSALELQHFEECAKCKQLLKDYRKLEELFALDADPVVIPDDFVDVVMARIDGEASTARKHGLARLHPVGQWVLLGLGVAMSISNIIQFVLFLLLPAY